LQPENDTPQRFYGRPANRSLQADKDFVRGMTLALNPNAPDNLTEDAWQREWQQFWSAADQQ
jgi:hypothetical protein